MRLFAVRLIEDKQAVGFFWAPNSSSLWWMIDSVCDPGLCECRRIRERAAITWESMVEATLGTGKNFGDDDADESEALVDLRNKMSFEYAFEDYIYSELNDGWVKVPHADEPGGGIYELYERESAQKEKVGKKRE